MLMVFLIVIGFLLILNWWTMKPFYWKDKGIPYSLPLPIIGNSFGQFFAAYYKYWNEEYKKVSAKGGIFGFHHFHSQALVVTKPEILKEIMVNQYDLFSSRGMYSNPDRDIYAKNLFNLESDEWKHIRTKLTPYFSPHRLKSMTQLMSTNMREFVDEFEKASNSGRPVDVNDLSVKLATDVVVNTIFGIEADSFKNPNSFFYLLQKEFLSYTYILKVLIGNVSPFLYNLCRLTLLEKSVTTRIKGFVEDVMRQRSKGIGVRQDFVQGMNELVQNDLSNPQQNNGKAFTEEDAAAQCMVMYMAGSESTGTTISYLLFELAQNQDKQDKLRDEINQVMSTEGSSFSYDTLKKLKYTQMAFCEVLRKYPILPVITRMCTKTTQLPGLKVDNGTSIFVPVMGIHMDPKYYPEPEKFIPERFATDENKNNGTFMPFGIGPRTCIGWKFSYVEMAYALCEIIPKYKILPIDKTTTQVTFNWKPTLSPQDGIKLIIEKL